MGEAGRFDGWRLNIRNGNYGKTLHQHIVDATVLWGINNRFITINV